MNNFKLSIIVFLLFLCILFFNYKTKVLSQEAIANNYNTISQEIEIVDNKITILNKEYKDILTQLPSLEETKEIQEIEQNLQNQIDELQSLIEELQKENEELKKELR